MTVFSFTLKKSRRIISLKVVYCYIFIVKLSILFNRIINPIHIITNLLKSYYDLKKFNQPHFYSKFIR